MRQPVKVLYHANCDDGFGAAYAAWCFFKNKEHQYDVEYIPVSYGQECPKSILHPHYIIYIVDFSYPRAVIELIKSMVKELTILDHHKTAEADLKDLSYAVFDMNRSGAMITWEYFHKAPAPLLIQYVQDNDIWLHKLPHSKAITRYIRSQPMTFQNWEYLDCIFTGNMNKVIDYATAIEQYFQTQVLFNAQHAKFLTDSHGRKCCVVNCNATFTSELLHHLIKEYSLNYGVSYFQGAREDLIVSFRGNGQEDVSVIAKSIGGGGHKSAAGVVWKGTIQNLQTTLFKD